MRISVLLLAVTLSVQPKFLVCIPTQSPTVNIKVWAERHQDNRLLVVTWDSDQESGASEYQLDGEAAQRSFFLQRRFSCASYLISACVYKASGKRTCANYQLEGGS